MVNYVDVIDTHHILYNNADQHSDSRGEARSI